MKIFKNDINTYDTFRRDGYDYEKVECNDKYSIWEVFSNGVSKGFEVWKPKKHKNPDGNIVIVRPSDEDFGRYGWYYPIRSKSMEERIYSLRAGMAQTEP